MKRFMYRFGYESPIEWQQNREHGTDFESSSAFWVVADSAEDALAWGREVSEMMVREFFIRSGWTGDIPSWKEDGYAHWIEEAPGPEFTPEFLDSSCPCWPKWKERKVDKAHSGLVFLSDSVRMIVTKQLILNEIRLRKRARMRQARQKQLNLEADWLGFEHAKELQAIAGLLDENPTEVFKTSVMAVTRRERSP